MQKVKDWLFDKKIWLTTGNRVVIANGGKSVDQIIIRHKEYFFCIDLDNETKEPTGEFGWSRDPGMFHVPIRDFYTAVRGDDHDVA